VTKNGVMRLQPLTNLQYLELLQYQRQYFDSSAQLVAAVTLIAHEATLEKEFDTFASLLKHATQSASRDLGYSC
jgi:hypothetical protein